ncbi:WD40 repeat domain-containing protein, partial [Candidatus Bathyarchaeota archaeon]|nr:WD40 repeat domain-containing protein [Candidatus Bathyarchaeota archaeon]
MEYFISDDDDFKNEIIDEITSRSQGNFLWATLVLNRIVHCLRPEDIRTALRATPDGMDKLYDRMAESITGLGRPADKELCRILLSWAVYSRRPVSIHELKGPYKSQLHSIIDLKHTVDQVCGQFVSVDQKENIVLVHQTARDYLRTTDSLPFSLNPEGSHDEMLCLCLQSLCDTSLRGKIRQRKTTPFIDYASSSWAFHLDQCSVESDAVLNTLSHFFSDIYPMLWIQLLSINGNLSLLVSVSSSIAKYARSRRRADAIKPPTLWRIEDLALLETWATDFLKITAKYGSHLTDDPESIFNCIPPFSPQSSAIFQTYSNKTANAISVTGVSNIDWDDCLARVAISSDKARHVAVSPEYLAVANDSPLGRIQLWDTVIFQEYKMLVAEQPICAIAFSQSGSLLACYGLDTTYVWKVSDGTIVAKVPNPLREKAIALKFAPREGRIIIATDLRRVYQLVLDDTSTGWCGFDSSLLEESSLPEGTFINSPSSVSLNVDCSQLAVAYRGFPLAVWGLDPPELIARCRRRHKQGQTMNTTWTGVNRVAWHPFTGHVLGIYRDGNIFKWGPMDDSHEEVKQELDATPSEIGCSPNGQVFATSDVKGTVKIYDYAHMVLIYRLTSEDLITAITFSPDSGRFFDIRGASCNVWEPNCLVRLVDKSLGGSEKSESVTTSDMEWGRKGSIASEVDDVQSMTTMSLAASEAHSESRAPITAVSTCRENQRLVAYSNNEGTVVVKDLTRDCAFEVSRSPFGMGVGQVALSHDGKRLAYSMLNGRVTVKDLDLNSPVPRERTKIVYSEKTSIQRGIIRQLLFQVGGNLLLVAGTERIHILDMPGGNIIASLDSSDFQGIRHEMWSVIPNDPERLLASSSEGARGYSWQNLQPPDIPKIIHDDANASQEVQQQTVIEALQPSFHPRMSLALTSTEKMGSKKFSFTVFQQAMGRSRPNGDTFVTEMTIPT